MATTDNNNYIAKHHKPNIQILCEICGEWESVVGFNILNEDAVELRYKCKLTPPDISAWYRLEKGTALPEWAKIRKCDCNDGR